MSFSTDIKKEILSYNPDETEVIAELSAIFNIKGIFKEDKIEIESENYDVIRRIYNLVKNKYFISLDIEKGIYNPLRKKTLSKIVIKDKKDLILNDLGIYNLGKRCYYPQDYIVDEQKEKEAYLRGAFLVSGSINDPKTSRYNLEFVISNKETAEFICNLFRELKFNSKIIKRDKSYMVYLKEAEQISDFIKILPATNSLFYYEDIRIYRDLQNMVNRTNNCDQANAEKTINASLEQLKLIEKLKENYDFDLLDEGIKNFCIYREKYPDVSIRELASIISLETGKKISKSGVNHRIIKIKNMIENKK